MTNTNESARATGRSLNHDSLLEVRTYRSIDEIEPVVWDSVKASNELYSTHRFFKSIESSGVMDASYWYIMFYQDSNLVATAVLSDFIVSLDLLLPKGVQKVCRNIRRVRKSFMKLRMLFCGIPLSIGKHTISISQSVSKHHVIKELHDEMEKIARSEQIKYICLKEFPESESVIADMLDKLEYIKARSVPRMTLNINWPTWDTYLSAMRHDYRRKVNKSLQKISLQDSQSPFSEEGSAESAKPRLIVSEFKPEHVSRMNEMYQDVMKRTDTKLEILNLDFFQQIARNMRNDLAFVSLQDEDGIQGAALLGRNGSSLNFLLVGFNYECRDRYQTYFNLLNGIISYGIEKEYDRIDLGQTTYHIKSRLGGESEEMFFYLKPLSTVSRLIIRSLNKLLFGKTQLPTMRVFRY